MTRYATTAYNRWQRVLGRFRDVVARTRIFKRTHAQHLHEMGEQVYGTKDYERLTQWAGGHIAGVADETRRAFERETVWAHRFGGESGYVVVASWDRLTEEEREQLRTNQAESTHIWRIPGDPERPTSDQVKPWGEWRKD